MPATSVTELLFEAKPRWSGTIGAGGVAASNTTTIPLSSAANLDNGDAYIFVINRVTSAGVKNELSEMETVIGELSGTNFVNCVRGQEGTAQAWEAGLVVEILFTASHWNKLIEWAESEHNADGTHSDITADSVTSGTIEATTSADLKTLAIDGGTAMTAVKDEDDMTSNSATALATQQSIKAYVDTSVYRDGWIPAGETWVYASADDPTFTFTVAGVDLTTKYYPGMRIKLTQTTVKYFIITAVTFSTNTTITVYGGTDYDLANAAITLPYYSTAKAPAGFPLSPVKWSVEVVNTANASQSSPTTGTWYNLGSITISVPIGVWNTKYQAHLRSEKASITYIDAAGTLSTANNSESDKEWTGYIGANGASGTISAKGAIYRSGVLTLTSKTSYYLNGVVIAISGGTADSVQFRGDLAETVITATSAYL